MESTPRELARGDASDARVAARDPGDLFTRESSVGVIGEAASVATFQAAATGIAPIRACHSRGPVSCTDVPSESTATVTGMSWTSNS